MSKYSHINFRPPVSVAKEAEKGLKYREMAGGKGGLSVSEAKSEGVGSGVQRAVNLKNRDTLSPETVKRMKAFFDRHKKNKSIGKGKEPWEDRGYVAWLLWGGDSGYAWSKKIVGQMEAADRKSKTSGLISREELSREDLFRNAVILANQNKPFSGGFDIMKQWQGEQTRRDPSGEEAYSGGMDIMKKWQGEQTGRDPSGEEAYSDGFGVMQQWQKEELKKQKY